MSFYNQHQQQHMMEMSVDQGFMVGVDPGSFSSSIVSHEDDVIWLSNNNQGNGGKRRHPDGGSDLVANTNTGY